MHAHKDAVKKKEDIFKEEGIEYKTTIYFSITFLWKKHNTQRTVTNASICLKAKFYLIYCTKQEHCSNFNEDDSFLKKLRFNSVLWFVTDDIEHVFVFPFFSVLHTQMLDVFTVCEIQFEMVNIYWWHRN